MDSLSSLIKALKDSFFHLVYPAACVHCQEPLAPNSGLLCLTCGSLLEFINPSERCPCCFGNLSDADKHKCIHCAQQPSMFYRTGAAFDYTGPAASLVRKFKYGNQPHLAKGMAGCLVTQFDQLKWPLPDAIIPIPISLVRWFERGYNQSTLLAMEFSSLLDVPVIECLTRKSGDYSQAGLSLEQRRKLDHQTFRFKGKSIKNKTVLLIDDVSTSGSTLNRCAEVLLEQEAAALYALTFCKAVV